MFRLQHAAPAVDLHFSPRVENYKTTDGEKAVEGRGPVWGAARAGIQSIAQCLML